VPLYRSLGQVLRHGAARPDSELAQQLVRDPYVFDHLALCEAAAERDLEQALMDRPQQMLVGRAPERAPPNPRRSR